MFSDPLDHDAQENTTERSCIYHKHGMHSIPITYSNGGGGGGGDRFVHFIIQVAWIVLQ